MEYQIRMATMEEAPFIYDSFIEPYFPEDEKKPLKAILRMMETGLYKIICVVEQDQIRGAAFLTTYPGGQIYLLDYLAVDKLHRSRGFGGILIQECQKCIDDRPILIETEALETASGEEELKERTKRNAFYQKNGALHTGVKTLIWNVTYDNWQVAKAPVSREVTIEELKNIYSFMFNNPKVLEERTTIPL